MTPEDRKRMAASLSRTETVSVRDAREAQIRERHQQDTYQGDVVVCWPASQRRMHEDRGCLLDQLTEARAQIAQAEDFRCRLSALVSCSSPSGSAELGQIECLLEQIARLEAEWDEHKAGRERLADALEHEENASSRLSVQLQAAESRLRAVVEVRDKWSRRGVHITDLDLLHELDAALRLADGTIPGAGERRDA